MDNISEHPGWIEISININPTAHEALGSFLFDMGCEGVVYESFRDKTLKAYLPFHEDIEETRNRIELFLHDLKGIFPEAKDCSLKLERLEQQDWDTGWRRFFKPDRISERLLILPVWEDAPTTTGRIIRIDPGPAFGTGHHPTTRMCLMAMEEATLYSPWTMLDVGTGSGILALYGSMLGASEVVAIDNDPEAVRWAKRNIEINDIPVPIDLSVMPIEEIPNTYNLVTANLILGTILGLFDQLTRVLAPNGLLVLSGILREQVAAVQKKIDEKGLKIERIMNMDEWSCIIVRKTK
ncbi:MAG: 50S ribosomal protein L11 methyltransferase [Deltaproteobacteria bacterium]|nr:50S ribosomal protein L11 methyltransferase [Deltaproteobacteria bacterium]